MGLDVESIPFGAIWTSMVQNRFWETDRRKMSAIRRPGSSRYALTFKVKILCQRHKVSARVATDRPKLAGRRGGVSHSPGYLRLEWEFSGLF